VPGASSYTLPRLSPSLALPLSLLSSFAFKLNLRRYITVLSMHEYVEKTCMQKESFVYALSVKQRMRIVLFHMCFIRIRANGKPSELDQNECCPKLVNHTVEQSKVCMHH